jgi:hypothetical protein
MKSIGNIANIHLVSTLVDCGFNLFQNKTSKLQYDGRVVKKETINLKSNDTFFIKFRHNDYFAKTLKRTLDLCKILGTDVIYSNQVSFKIETQMKNNLTSKLKKEAKGKSLSS